MQTFIDDRGPEREKHLFCGRVLEEIARTILKAARGDREPETIH